MKKEKIVMKTETMMILMFLVLFSLIILVGNAVAENKQILMTNNTIAQCEIQDFANDQNTNSSQILFNCPFQINQTGKGD